MLFNSYIFVLFFLPFCIFMYFVLNKYCKGRQPMIFLLGMSLWFYGYFNWTYLLIMLSSIVFNYLAYIVITRCEKIEYRKLFAAIAVVFNVGILFYFKYYDFFIQNINTVFQCDFAEKNILLPLGISFFTFQQLSFVIDSYRGEVPKYNFIDYACFVTYFPQLVAGPIVTHDDLIPQFVDDRKKKVDWDKIFGGGYTFLLGLSKKVLLADVFGIAVNWGYENISSLNFISAVIVMLCYTLQIYFDFSGYSEMAIGMAKMMNIDLPLNFNSPYKATTINEFWDRWHMTLTRFFTRYVYIPLGGNRRGKVRTYINIMIVYLLSGIWHGANWTFIVWGLLHGLFCVVTRCLNELVKKIPVFVNWIITFAFVNVTWVLFRAESMSDALMFLGKLKDVSIGAVAPELVESFVSIEWQFFFSKVLDSGFLRNYSWAIMTLYIIGSLMCVVTMKNVNERMKTVRMNVVTMLIIPVLLVLCVFSFAGVSSFLYFNF